jgi:hypothetical protein
MFCRILGTGREKAQMSREKGQSRHSCAHKLTIAQTESLEETDRFKNDIAQKKPRWVYCYLKQWNLLIRHVTRAGQNPSGHLQQIKEDTTTIFAA